MAQCTNPEYGPFFRPALQGTPMSKRKVERMGYWRCKQCLSCKLAKTDEWILRMLHEQTTTPGISLFVTLTYADEHLIYLPGSNNPTVCISETQAFFDRFRDRLNYSKFKYLLVGDYGPETFRPHYHFASFFSDPALSYNHVKQLLESSWQMKGFVTVDNLIHERMAYLVRYITEKLYNNKVLFDSLNVKPIFQSQSKGIGKEYAQKEIANRVRSSKFQSRIRGRMVGIPRYYRKILGITNELLQPGIDEKISQEADIIDSHPKYDDLSTHFKHELERLRTSSLEDYVVFGKHVLNIYKHKDKTLKSKHNLKKRNIL